MLTIRLLGEQQVMVDGVSVEALHAPRTLGLLGYLVLHAGIPQMRQHVAGLFWPDSSEGQARTNLRRELHHLRASLPEPDRCLVVGSSTVCWRTDAPCTIDLTVFQDAATVASAAANQRDESAFLTAARRAADAYGGAFLPALYDDWVLEARDHLQRLCISLVDRLAVVLATHGDWQAAIRHAYRRVELDPLEESGYRLLMRLQADAGDRASALRTFHRCSSVLREELGVEPSAETLGVYAKLFSRPPEPVAAAPDTARPVSLVGRKNQLDALNTLWAKVATAPAFGVIAGEAGVGKSRVIAEFADAVQRGGGLVARARCFPSQARVVLAPVAEWMRSTALRQGLARMDEVWRSQVSRLVPELGAGEREDRPDPLANAWQRRQFYEGLVHAVLASGRPILLVLDDLQWCDNETLAWLEFLFHFDAAAPVLVVATLRSEELYDHPQLVACCRRLRAEGVLEEHELAPLTASEVAELAQALGGAPLDDVATQTLKAQTGGFPLFVVESMRHGWTGSSRMDAVLSDRLAQLSPAAEELAGLAAAVGRDFSLELLLAVGTFDDESLVKGVDELWHRRLIRQHSAVTYDFTHDLLRAAAYDRLSPLSRRFLHRRIAAALCLQHADDMAAVAAQVADQYERGDQPALAIDYHVMAAETAKAIFAHSDAVRHFDRAMELLAGLQSDAARDQRELKLLQAMFPSVTALHGYASGEVGALVERTSELSSALGAHAIHLRSQGAMWAHLFVRGQIKESLALCERLDREAADHPSHAGWVRMVGAGSLTSLGRPLEALPRFRAAEEWVDTRETFLYGFRVKVMARAWRAHAFWLTGQAEDAAASALAALELADETEQPFDQAIARAYGAITYYLRGDSERAGALSVSVRDLCDRYGFAYYGEWGRLIEGRLIGGAAAEALMRAGLDKLRQRSAETRVPFWHALLAEVLWSDGRGGEAQRVLAEACTSAEARGDRWWLAELWRLRAAMQPGAKGEAMLQHALMIATEQKAVALELRAATDLARRWYESGSGERAADLLRSVLGRAQGCNAHELGTAVLLLNEAAPVCGASRTLCERPPAYRGAGAESTEHREEGENMNANEELTQTVMDALETRLRGRVSLPGQSGYDSDRSVWNGMIDRRPGAIAHCADVADVMAAITVAREHGVPVAVRGGGHSAAGMGVCQGGLVIDLSAMRGVRVDPAARTVTVDGGCTLGDVDHATHAFGLAMPGGIISTTGIGGLTLGGGTGYLARRHGLTIDNLLSADVVLADGSFVTASAEEHPDLFWALRGGGGNFGIVTSFRFRCHPLATVVAGPVFHDTADTGRVLRWYREFMPSAPEDLYGFFMVGCVPPGPPFPEHLHGRPVCGALWVYTGASEGADEALAPVRAFGSPLLDGIQEMPFPALQAAFDALYPPGLQSYWRGDYFVDIPDEAVAVHEAFAEVPTPLSTMHLYPIDGEAHRVGAADTAFYYRHAKWSAVILGIDPDPANADRVRDWVVRYWDALHPTSAGGGYVNFMMDEGQDRVRATYGPNYERLARIKGMYDPDNVFRFNQNIEPMRDVEPASA
ncbi:FAD-binding protein [Aquisalimonas sp. APHAB1-3]|uniref:FAD-binding protein n=1 Tax=Aquisalimonas sp. APHAB1-3 TaxID=3402080 RepID=UPI003AACCC0F